jgi:hypothetical protein
MHRPRSEGCKSRERNGVFPLDCGLRRNDECILPGNDLFRTIVGVRENDAAMRLDTLLLLLLDPRQEYSFGTCLCSRNTHMIGAA